MLLCSEAEKLMQLEEEARNNDVLGEMGMNGGEGGQGGGEAEQKAGPTNIPALLAAKPELLANTEDKAVIIIDANCIVQMANSVSDSTSNRLTPANGL